jgi:hypothetical protein
MRVARRLNAASTSRRGRRGRSGRHRAELPGAMQNTGLLPSFIGARAYDRDGARLGHVADVLFDVSTRRPDWLLLVLLRATDRFVHVPAHGARHRAGGVLLCCERALVRTAPTTAAPPFELQRAHALQLARHYGVRGAIAGPWEGLAEPAFALADDRVRMAG